MLFQQQTEHTSNSGCTHAMLTGGRKLQVFLFLYFVSVVTDETEFRRLDKAVEIDEQM